MTDDPLASFRLDGRVVVITGASGGLGERFARVAHAVGGQVVLAARRTDRLEMIAEQLPGALVVRTDVEIPEDRERLVATTLDELGTVDVLVNNAGITSPIGIEDEELDYFERTMNVNVTAAWHLMKLVGPTMVARRSGSVVNIASVLGLVGSAPIKQAHYTASKGAVVQLTREMALQWARKGIRVNALCPGWFRTDMTDGMEDDEASLRFITTNTPIPRMADAEELDGAFLLLASDAGSFITGHMLVVDGGWSAR
jgi:NAD(P)-dependent dehydrogenase (short-subunit alcohol dehydrogenase family)